MDDQVSWLLEMTVKPGELDNLKALIKEMVESTGAEPGALNYQWCISDDNTTVHNFDRYSDSAAAKTHLDGFLANYAGATWQPSTQPGCRCTALRATRSRRF